METNTPSPEDNILAALAYIPGVFLITALIKGKNPFHLWHAKMGAFSTFIFIFPVVITAFVNGLIGIILYVLFFIFIVIAGLKAWKGQKLEIPGLSGLISKIPLEIFVSDLVDASKQIQEIKEAKRIQSLPAEEIKKEETIQNTPNQSNISINPSLNDNNTRTN